MITEERSQVRIDPRVFNEVYRPYLKAMERTQILFGGSSSGKSVFLAQRCVLDILMGGRNYLVCRAVGRSVRKSVYNEIRKVITTWGLEFEFYFRSSEPSITCSNGYQILFTGLDDVEKVKSITPEQGVITDIWIEEATEVEYPTFKELRKRLRGGHRSVPKRVTLSFNPIVKDHWIYNMFFVPVGWDDDQQTHRDEKLSIRRTWYIHNRFLTEQDTEDLLDETDSYYRDVYTFGKWGVLGNVIFKNWKTADLSNMKNQFVNRRNGLDFGFSNDPAGMPVTHYDRKRSIIYIFDELYERGLTNDLLAADILKMIGKDRLTCDSAEPKSIAELRDHGVNAVGAKKGRDSVNFGIQWLQQQTIVIDKKCVNSINEFTQYRWDEDRDGNPIRRPVDKTNHIIDGLRYAYEHDMVRIQVRTKAKTANYIRGKPSSKRREIPF